MAYVHLAEKDANNEIVSDRYINKDHVVTVTVEKDSKTAAVVMSNGDCIVVPVEILSELGIS